MSTSSFTLTSEEYAHQYEDDGILKNGLAMDHMQGVWLAWETDEEAVKAALPPALDYAAPIVMSYIIEADTAFAGNYREAALILMCQHDEVPGVLLQSLLLDGEGAPQALYLGREMAGMPKKICDSVELGRDSDTARASVTKSGVKLLDCTLELGAYNTPAGEQLFGNNKPGEVVDGGTSYLIKYDLEQHEDGSMHFEQGRLLTTTSDNEYSEWVPGTASITLADCPDAPWASMPVKQVLAGGWGSYRMFNFATSKVCDIDAEENAPSLLRARFDNSLLV